jgi:hypothetical protein
MMIKGAAIELESFRLAQYSTPVRCYICGEGNLFDAELCRLCFAPMALAYQAATQKAAPSMLATLGASGVGKTAYLGMLLDMLSRQPERLNVLARGAFSITLQQMTASAMARCEFPCKTPSEPDRWNWVHCQIQKPKQKRPSELIMPDLAGEALFEEVDHPRTFRVIQPLLTQAAGVLLLVDAFRLQDGVPDQDYFTLKLLSYLSELGDDPKTGWRYRPLAIIFSKADEADECFDNPEAFAERHAPRLWEHCRRSFGVYKFFAAGLAGACTRRMVRGETRRVPLRVEPRGVIEPFEWLLAQLKL